VSYEAISASFSSGEDIMRLIELTIAATIGVTLDGEELGKRSGKRLCRHQ
jgi:hypothetical protein